MSEQGGNGAQTVPLVAGVNGGAIAAPWKPGQSGNPRGAISKRARLALAYAEEVGLAGLFDLAWRYRKSCKRVNSALIDAACGEWGPGAIAPAQSMLRKLVRQVDAEAENQSVLELTVKIRAMDDEPRTIEVQQVESNGHANGAGDGSADER